MGEESSLPCSLVADSSLRKSLFCLNKQQTEKKNFEYLNRDKPNNYRSLDYDRPAESNVHEPSFRYVRVSIQGPLFSLRLQKKRRPSDNTKENKA